MTMSLLQENFREVKVKSMIIFFVQRRKLVFLHFGWNFWKISLEFNDYGLSSQS